MRSNFILSPIAILVSLSIAHSSLALAADDPQATSKPNSDGAAIGLIGSSAGTKVGQVCICDTSPIDKDAPSKSAQGVGSASSTGGKDQSNNGAE